MKASPSRRRDRDAFARPELRWRRAGLTRVPLPVDKPLTPLTAEALFPEASDLRQKDFAGSAQRYLQAARVQLDALRRLSAAGRG